MYPVDLLKVRKSMFSGGTPIASIADLVEDPASSHQPLPCGALHRSLQRRHNHR
jgi:hypothetical protein